MVHLRDLCALQHTEAALGKANLHAAAEHSRGGGVRTAVKDAAASPNMSMSPSRASRPISGAELNGRERAVLARPQTFPSRMPQLDAIVRPVMR